MLRARINYGVGFCQGRMKLGEKVKIFLLFFLVFIFIFLPCAECTYANVMFHPENVVNAEWRRPQVQSVYSNLVM